MAANSIVSVWPSRDLTIRFWPLSAADAGRRAGGVWARAGPSRQSDEGGNRNSGELRARSGVKHVHIAVKLTLEGLPIYQTDGTRTGDRPETASRRLDRYRQSGRRGEHRPTAVQDDGLAARRASPGCAASVAYRSLRQWCCLAGTGSASHDGASGLQPWRSHRDPLRRGRKSGLGRSCSGPSRI
jgi:hypothetical protein